MLDQVDFIVQNSGSNATPDDDAIIRVHVVKLESYLQNIKMQMQRMEHEFKQSLKSEGDKQSTLNRKLEHCELDINSVRDLIYGAKNMEKADPLFRGKEKKLEPMAYLRNEVDSLRMIIRRVELQQATGIDVFTQIKELQRKTTAQLEHLVHEEEERKNDVSSLRNEFTSRMDGLENKLEATHKDLQILQFRFKTIVEEIQEIQSKLDTDKDKKKGQGSGSNNALNELTVTAILDERKMQTIAEAAVQNAIAQLKDKYVSTEKCIGILHESDEQAKKMKRQAISIKKYAAAHMIRYSDRRNYSIYRKLLKKGFISIYNFAVEVNTQRMEHLQNIGEKFVRRLYPVVNNFFLQSFFNFWAMGTEKLKIRDRMRPRMKTICKKWLDRVLPDLEGHFRQWIFFTRSKAEESKRKRHGHSRQSMRSSIMNSVSQNQNHSPKAGGGGSRATDVPSTSSFVGGEGVGSKINSALKAIQELQCETSTVQSNSETADNSLSAYNSSFNSIADMGTLPFTMSLLGPKVESSFEDVIKFKMVDDHEEMIHELKEDLSTLMGTVEIINSRLTRMTSNWDESERERAEKIDIENKKMISNINSFKSSVTVKFNILQSDSDEAHGKLRVSLADNAAGIKSLSTTVTAMNDVLKTLPGKLDATVVAQQALTGRMNEMDSKQELLGAKIKAIDGEIVFASKAALSSVEQSKKVEEMFVDSTSYFDGELKALKKISSASVSRIAEISLQQDENEERNDNRLRVVEKKQDAILPALPSPEELFELCTRFETLQSRFHKEGDHGKKIQKKANSLINDIAEFVNRLASNLCAAADLAVLNDLLDGFAPSSLIYKAAQLTAATEPNIDGGGGGGGGGVVATLANSKTSLSDRKAGVEVKRRELLDEFMDKFVDLLKASDPNPGILRTEARVKFNRKFSTALEAALSKHSMMKQQSDYPPPNPNNSFIAKSLLTPSSNPVVITTQSNSQAQSLQKKRGLVNNFHDQSRPASARPLLSTAQHAYQAPSQILHTSSMNSQDNNRAHNNPQTVLPESNEHPRRNHKESAFEADGAVDFADSLVDSVDHSEHVTSLHLKQPFQQSQQQQQKQSFAATSINPIHAADANATHATEMVCEAPVQQSDMSQHIDNPMDSEEFVSEETLLMSTHKGRSNLSLNRLRPNSARIMHPTYAMSTTSPSPLMKSSSASSGVKTKPITVRASGFRMPSPALQTEFAAILAENFKKDSTFHSQNSVPLTLHSDANSTSFSPHYINSINNNNSSTSAALNDKQSSHSRALQRPFSSTASRRDDSGNGDGNNTLNSSMSNNINGHGSAYSTRKLVAAKEKPKKVLSP